MVYLFDFIKMFPHWGEGNLAPWLNHFDNAIQVYGDFLCLPKEKKWNDNRATIPKTMWLDAKNAMLACVPDFAGVIMDECATIRRVEHGGEVSEAHLAHHAGQIMLLLDWSNQHTVNGSAWDRKTRSFIEGEEACSLLRYGPPSREWRANIIIEEGAQIQRI